MPSPQDPKRLRYPRSHRLVSGAGFKRAYALGGRARGRELIVVALANGLAHPRLGLSVGKRIWKSAVRRNKVRRVLREAFRLRCAELPAGYDLILIPAVPRLEPQLAGLADELVRLSRQAAAKADRKAAAREAPDIESGSAREPDPTSG